MLIGFNALRLIGCLATAVLVSACVPFGDCWPDVTADLRLGSEVQARVGVPVVIAGVAKIYEEDVTGVDQQAVPVSSDGLLPFASGQLSATARAATLVFRGYPYPSWYVAFLDSNRNKTLDPGEPFGVDPDNPRPGTCEAYATAIEINSIRVDASP